MIMKLIGSDGGANFALAILLFTLIVKLLLFPLQMKSKKGMMDQQRLQPQIKKLEKKNRLKCSYPLLQYPFLRSWNQEWNLHGAPWHFP